MVKTINISLEESDLARIDEFAMAHSVTRSKFIVQCAIDRLESEKMANAISTLAICASSLALKGHLTDDERAMLVRIDSFTKRGDWSGK